METAKPADSSDTRMPRQLVWAVWLVCAAPILLNLAGMNFGSQSPPLDLSAAAAMAKHRLADSLHHSLAGSFTHTILEWSAFCTAIFTVFLAFVHYHIKRDVTTPIIGMALFCAGCMDAFHTLAADRLIEVVADNRDLVPFTWALCRVFNGLIMIVGVGVLLIRPKGQPHRAGFRFVIAVSLMFGLIAYAVISYCASSAWLPRTQFPSSWITRPYDLIPLTLFLFAYVFVYRPFHQKERSLFSHALMVSVVPEVATQLHVSLGSSALFDNHFNIAHFLKVGAYAVPLTGLVLDYVHTYRAQARVTAQLKAEVADRLRAQQSLKASAERLRQSNRELEEFARVASHDLQEPLRKVQAFGDRLKVKYADQLPEDGRDYVQRMQNATARMQALINDLLTFSRVTTKTRPFEPVDVSVIAQEVLSDLEYRIHETGGRVVIEKLPTLQADPTQIRQLLQNLIANALKYHQPGVPPVVHVAAEPVHGAGEGSGEGAGAWRITVTDNGIGFDMRYLDRIFAVFQRLHGRGEYEGTGVGLALCRKIAQRHGGSITATSEPGQGAIFTVTLPARQPRMETAPCAA